MKIPLVSNSSHKLHWSFIFTGTWDKINIELAGCKDSHTWAGYMPCSDGRISTEAERPIFFFFPTKVIFNVLKYKHIAIQYSEVLYRQTLSNMGLKCVDYTYMASFNGKYSSAPCGVGWIPRCRNVDVKEPWGGGGSTIIYVQEEGGQHPNPCTVWGSTVL